jgi:hypothetical protein
MLISVSLARAARTWRVGGTLGAPQPGGIYQTEYRDAHCALQHDIAPHLSFFNRTSAAKLWYNNTFV